MKKYLFLIPVLLLASSSHAADFCVKKTTYAVNAQGVCEKFSTTCAVPADSKVVPKCDIVKDSTGSRPEDVLERRRQQKAAAYAARRAARSETTTTRRMNYSGTRIGAGALTRNKNTRKTADPADLADRSRRRTSTYRRGASSTYVKMLNQYRNTNTGIKQVGRTKGIMSSVDNSLREGKLSNGQKFSDETHFRTKTDDTATWEASLKRRNYLIDGRRIKKTYVPKTLTLKRFYRGGTKLRDIRMNAGVDAIED